jgi:imidazolonepropionase-like amidohydrolase
MIIRPLLAFSALFLVAAPASAQTADELVIVANGETVGHVRSTREGDRISVDYLVDNNGRGPRHREEIVVGTRSVPVSYTIEGRSLMGGPVSESYGWANGRATWRSQADSGEVAAAQPPLYVVNDGSPYTLGVYARALLADADHKMPVLPGGELRLERVRDMVLGEGAGTVPVTIYRIDGIDLSPDYVMLGADGRLVATLGTGSVAIRRGLEGQVERINKLAEEIGSERARRLQQQLAHRFDGPVRIRNVRIFDPKAGALGPVSTVVVEGERISAVVPGLERGPTPAGQTIIDGEGGTLVSGLHDMHSHSSLSSGLFYLAAGVTSLRDMGNENDFLTDLMARIERGEVAGPRIVRNGFLEGRSPFSARNGIIVDSEAEAVKAVDWYADRDYWQIKVYNSMNPAWVPAITAEAHKRGMKVTGHIPAFTTPDEMIRAGYDEIAHINQLMLGWLIRPGEDTRTPLRLTAMARAADLDLTSEPVQATVRLMRERGIPLDTTAVILERLMLSRAGTVAPGDVAYLDHMPIGYQRYRRRSFVTINSPEEDEDYRQGFQRLIETISLLHRNGIRLLPGTDDGTGFTLQRELELYQQAGIPAAEVLRMATIGMEDYLGRADRLGSIEPGKLADFFLVPGDPTREISEVRKVRLVMRGGVAYLPSEIYPALGIRPFTEPPPIHDPAALKGERG